jgi:hypothetical protein
MNNFVLSEIFRSRRGVADLKSAGSNPMGVQVPLRAPTKQKTYKKNAAREREAFFVWWLF